MIDVSVIVVSYNTQEMTLACLHSVCEQTEDISYELIVVDNNSNDASAHAIEMNYPDVILIKSDKNLGFARANNLAAQRAQGKYLLLLNPDTVVLDGAVQKLYQFAMSHPRELLYGGRTLFGDYSLNPTSCWKQPTLWSLFCYATGLGSVFRKSYWFDPESYGSWQRDSIRNVDIVTGCFLMIEKRLWDQLDGFDPDFFMYGEDADLCLRAVKNGAAPIINPEATIIHYCGASEKVRSDMMIRLFRAKEQLIKKHWNPFSRWLGLRMIRLSAFSRAWACSFFCLLGYNKMSKNAESWQEIWRRRREWIEP